MDPTCCTPAKLNQEELKWSLMWILDLFEWLVLSLPYVEVKLLKADERDRPSLKIKKETKQPKNVKNAIPSSTSIGKESVDLASPISITAQNAREVVYCLECKKPRAIYSKNKLNYNQRFEYSYRPFLFPPDAKSNL